MQNITWTIGDVRITRIVEVEAQLPFEEFLPQASPEALAPHAEWLRPPFLNNDGSLTISVHALLVESAGQKIIVDTCVGEKPIEGFEILNPASYDFLDRLAAAGFPRESIDTVLCTHLHFDHVGWNTMREGDRWVPTFPNARYLFARTEWDHWRNQEEAPFTSTLTDTVTCVIDAGLADLVALEGLERLRVLRLGETKVTDAGLAHLKALEGLRQLGLRATEVTDAGLVHLKGLTQLQMLNLQGTKVTDAGLVHLKGLSNLRQLYLWDTKVTDEGVKKLREALPKCKIAH